MKEMIGYEIRKLLFRPLVWASLAGVLFMAAVMILNWIAPGSVSVREDVDGKEVTLEGLDAVLRNREIAGQYEGPLTTEKVRDIIEAFRFSQAMMEAEGMEPERQRHYVHNNLYDTFARAGFAAMSGEYNGADITEVYGAMAPDLTVGYSAGWESTCYALAYTLLSWGCVLIIIISPVFSDEYTRGTDALILTGSRGRRACPLAKVIASYIVTLGGTLLLIGLFFFVFLASHGAEGLNASVQLGEMAFFFDTPYPISWKEAFAFACLAWLGAVVVLASLTLMISAWAKNSFSALVITFTIYALPLFFSGSGCPPAVKLVLAMLPITQLELRNLFSLELLSLGGLQFKAMWLILPVSAALAALGTLLPKRAFSRHQVM